MITFDDLKKKDLLWSIQFSILSIRKAYWQKYRPLKGTLQDFYFSDKKYSDYGFFFFYFDSKWDSLIHISRIDFTGLVFFTLVIKSKGKTKENTDILANIEAFSTPCSASEFHFIFSWAGPFPHLLYAGDCAALELPVSPLHWYGHSFRPCVSANILNNTMVIFLSSFWASKMNF